MYILHFSWVEKVTSPYLQSWWKGLFDVFCYVPSADHDYVLHTQDERHGTPADIYKQSIYCAMLFDWPGSCFIFPVSLVLFVFPAAYPGLPALFCTTILLMLYARVAWNLPATMKTNEG